MNWDAPTVFKQLPKAGMHFVTFGQILARCWKSEPVCR